MPVTNFLWDDDTDTVVMEKDGNGTVTAEYTTAPRQYGRLLSQHRDGTTSHFHYDGNGNTRALTDASQTVTDRYTYTAFGDQVATTGTTENRYRFGGQYGYQYNEATDDYYVRARVYEPNRGRWASVDPIQFANPHDILFHHHEKSPWFVMQFAESIPRTPKPAYSYMSAISGIDPSGLAPKKAVPYEEYWKKDMLPFFKHLSPKMLDKLYTQYKRGCIGVTSCFIGIIDKRSAPDVSHCYRDLKTATDLAEEWSKAGKCCEGEKRSLSVLGRPAGPIVFNLQFSSNERIIKKKGGRMILTHKRRKIRSVKGTLEGRFDLTPHLDVIGQSDPAKPGGVNYDFSLKWSREDLWIHATKKAPNMIVKEEARKDIEAQFAHPMSPFDKMFYCVACQKIWEKGAPRPTKPRPKK